MSTNPAVWRARSLFDTYSRSSQHYDEPEQTALEDMLADLRHFAAEKGLDWQKATDMADLHFEEESES
ncbi:hypothetical protein 40AC_80 [Mycobacterium phage 40AC]|uniref:Uncharacterized protein n=1 Tax=Mycobacterium phage 40AC TaxID=1458717 RepID=W8EAN1_9CAUD|nr:hypothetical protein ST40AC_80 [Mycobacterium phage 40AC]AHJ86443.1 hypothetical protein 40AC_80 [Mycobacterium phage 40AC]